MAQTNENVATVMLDQLYEWGVKRIYGVVGDAILGLMDALAEQTQIQFIAVKHESVAAMMASAEAKLTGNLGVCVATMGPGLGNLINGLADAHLDKAPVLAITGQAPTMKIGTDYKQYIDQQELIKPIATYTSLLAHPDAVTDLLVKAMSTSCTKGAVTHLSIPKDIFDQSTKAKIVKKPSILKPQVIINEEDLMQIETMMKQAKKPMILAGLGAKDAVQEVIDLSKLWGAGILVSLGAKGFFPYETPHLVGGIGQGGNPYAKDLFKQADVVLLVGDTWWPEGYVPTSSTIIQIDLVQEHIASGNKVDLGIVGDAKQILQSVLKTSNLSVKNEGWVNQFLEAKEKWKHDNEVERAISSSPLHPSRIIKGIEDAVQSDAIITIDTGDVTVWMNRNFNQKNQWMLFSGEWRTMGFGLPAALAAKLCLPNRQVLAVVGDGGIEMTLADLLTAIRHNIDITVVVFNNHALQMERDKMVVGGYKEEGVALTNPDFVQIALACGWQGFSVEKESDLDKMLQEATESRGPTLVSIETAAVVHPESKK